MENPDIDRPAVHIGSPFSRRCLSPLSSAHRLRPFRRFCCSPPFFCFCCLSSIRTTRNFVLSLIATAAAFAVFAVAMNLFVLPTERYDGGTYTVTGNVESPPHEKQRAVLLQAACDTHRRARTGCRFFGTPLPQRGFPAEIGDTVTCEAKFFAFEDSLGLLPAHLVAWRITWSYPPMVTDYESVQVTPAEKRPFSYYVNQIRTHFHNLFWKTNPKAEGSVLSAMLLGLRDDMETELVSAYKKAGARTFWPYPGMHMAILTQFTLGFLGLLG